MMTCPHGHGPMYVIFKNISTHELRYKCRQCGYKETVKESEVACG